MFGQRPYVSPSGASARDTYALTGEHVPFPLAYRPF